MIAGFAARLTSVQIAETLGVTAADVTWRLRQAAFAVIGVDHVRAGDLIVDIDHRPAWLVVTRAFGPLEPGGSSCLGISYPSSTHSYKLWEHTELAHPHSVHMLLVRAGRSNRAHHDRNNPPRQQIRRSSTLQSAAQQEPKKQGLATTQPAPRMGPDAHHCNETAQEAR